MTLGLLGRGSVGPTQGGAPVAPSASVGPAQTEVPRALEGSVDAFAQADIRRRRIVRIALSGILTKAAAFLPALGISPLAVQHLGAERFGVLMTVLSLLAFMNIADLGVGGTLVTRISRAVGSGNARRVRSLQANGLAAVSAMAFVVFLTAIGLVFSNVGGLIFPHSSASVRDEATHTLAVFVLLFALGLPMGLVTKIQLGLQKGHVANHWQTLAGLINFACGAFACVMNASMPWIILGLLSGTLSCGVANTLLQLYGPSGIRPSLRDVRRPALIHLMRDSLFYLALQLIFLVTYAVDTLIVARQLGAEQASTYALAERLFSVVAVAMAVVTGPLWAAYGEALGNRDYAWAQRCLRVSLWRIGLVGGAMSLTLLFLFQPLVTFFGAGALTAPLGVAAAMAIWRVVEAIGGSIAVYLFATEAVRLVLVTGAVTAAVSVTAKVLSVSHLGPSALPAVTTVCFVVFSLVPCWRYIRRSERAVDMKGS